MERKNGIRKSPTVSWDRVCNNDSPNAYDLFRTTVRTKEESESKGDIPETVSCQFRTVVKPQCVIFFGALTGRDLKLKSKKASLWISVMKYLRVKRRDQN